MDVKPDVFESTVRSLSITNVVRLTGIGASAPARNDTARHPPTHIVKQKRIKMFRFAVKHSPAAIVNLNGIISV